MHQNSDDTAPAWVKEAHDEAELQHIFWLQEQQ
jgi:hypothetical protein